MKTFLRALGTILSAGGGGAGYAGDAVAEAGRGSGMQRQLSALLGSGDLRRYSRRIAAPTLVIHGDRDRLVRKAGGVAIARAVANAKLHIMPGMGMTCPRH
ncbi:alpha/beta hydrolase [Serratia ureilytica]